MRVDAPFDTNRRARALATNTRPRDDASDAQTRAFEPMIFYLSARREITRGDDAVATRERRKVRDRRARDASPWAGS